MQNPTAFFTVYFEQFTMHLYLIHLYNTSSTHLTHCSLRPDETSAQAMLVVVLFAVFSNMENEKELMPSVYDQ